MPEACHVSVYIATSVDGFIAREDGGLDWLPQGSGASGQDYGYHAFMASIDVLVMGRKTFEMVMGFGEWPYGETPVVVLSRSLTKAEVPRNMRQYVTVMDGTPTRNLDQLAASGVGKIYLDGGRAIPGFLKERAVDRLIITTIPVLIGTGIPLFGELLADVPLQHRETRVFPSGIVQTAYDVGVAEGTA